MRPLACSWLQGHLLSLEWMPWAAAAAALGTCVAAFCLWIDQSLGVQASRATMAGILRQEGGALQERI